MAGTNLPVRATPLALAAAALFAATAADARVTRIEVTAQESPTFGGGRTWVDQLPNIHGLCGARRPEAEIEAAHDQRAG